MRLPVAALLALSSTACVGPARVAAPAPEPKAQVVVPATVSVVRNRLVERCAEAGFMVFEPEDSAIVCGSTIEGPEAGPYLARSGNPHAMPEQKVRFSLSQQGQLVLVTADPWVELLTASGETRTDTLESPRRKGQIRALLNSLTLR